ncbi:hypothetical protein FQN60_016700 [Etheostoma spectabile]|uniref:Uncharacterized protein n=1 Tax=Etheostoma spectabile TaxID=54343 RepID=A0A5J5CZY1_9PERO|nr:hypothetical protein FQN60_016109 [Etheostoma spectabile]KAA8587838.1 hypothetical protein FQN60_016700 [Etheostoma spectabile]
MWEAPPSWWIKCKGVRSTGLNKDTMSLFVLLSFEPRVAAPTVSQFKCKTKAMFVHLCLGDTAPPAVSRLQSQQVSCVVTAPNPAGFAIRERGSRCHGNLRLLVESGRDISLPNTSRYSGGKLYAVSGWTKRKNSSLSTWRLQIDFIVGSLDTICGDRRYTKAFAGDDSIVDS